MALRTLNQHEQARAIAQATGISVEGIDGCLAKAAQASPRQVQEVLAKARSMAGLTLEETAILLQRDDPETLSQIFAAAAHVKDAIYGRRVVLFAPLYISNLCTNNCLYCSFRRDNKEIERRILSMDEIADQVRILEDMGHKRLLVECGEHPSRSPIEFVTEAIEVIYRTRSANGSIRRVNVNIAATTIEDYRRLKAAGIGTYQLFQETYHRPTYAAMHPTGFKSDYDWHLSAMNRAMEGGIDDVGLGVLFGLYDYRFEVLALLQHASYLEREFGVGPHTISVPRWRPAEGVDFAPPYAVSDKEFKKIVAILRLAVPYTGIILSTRESAAMRDDLLSLGVSQMSAASATSPGGYSRSTEHSEQFRTADHRSVDEIVREICRRGYLPSFCTACYRRGRTGEAFMKLAKPGEIHEFCAPNALLTFKEYLEDYASEETRKVAEATVRQHLQAIEQPSMVEATVQRMERIEQGERDLYF